MGKAKYHRGIQFGTFGTGARRAIIADLKTRLKPVVIHERPLPRGR
jgi:hypothetical protein